MIYELRTYKCLPGRLDTLLERFDKAILQIWEDYPVDALGFWTDRDTHEVIYLLRWETSEQRATTWSEFAKDQRWLDAKAASEIDGPIVESFSSKNITPTSFSALK